MLESEAMAILVGAGVSYGRREAALRAAGSALAILAEPGLYAAQLQEKGLALLRHAIADEARLLGGLAKKKMALVLREDAQYPPLLRQIAHPPHLLYVYGETDLTDRFPVAVVGTRRASAYGLTHTREIAAELRKPASASFPVWRWASTRRRIRARWMAAGEPSPCWAARWISPIRRRTSR